MGAEQRAVTEARQVASLLTLTAEPHDGTLDRPQLRVQGKGEPIVRAPFAEPLHHEHRRRQVDLAATEIRGNREPENAKARAPRPQVAIEASRVIALVERVVRELAAREVT